LSCVEIDDKYSWRSFRLVSLGVRAGESVTCNGARVGLNVGSGRGAALGEIVGPGLGCGVGSRVGAVVGLIVGSGTGGVVGN